MGMGGMEQSWHGVCEHLRGGARWWYASLLRIN